MDWSCTYRRRRTCGTFKYNADTNKQGEWRNQKSMLAYISYALFRATQNRYNEISRHCHAQENTQIYKALRFLSDIFSILYLQGGCEKSSWQNAPASQAEEPPASTLGICHTSLLPFCCSRQHNSNKSTTLGVQTRSNLCQRNKRFKEYSFVILNPVISKQWRGLWGKKAEGIVKANIRCHDDCKNENKNPTMAWVLLKHKAQTPNVGRRLH